MSEYLIGELVDITIKNARITAAGEEGQDADVTDIIQVATTAAEGGTYYTTVPLGWDTVAVEHVAPPEWPPLPGDLWRDAHSTTWFAQKYFPEYDDREDSKGINADGWRVVLTPVDGGGPYGRSSCRPDEVNREHGRMTLAHREGGEEA